MRFFERFRLIVLALSFSINQGGYCNNYGGYTSTVTMKETMTVMATVTQVSISSVFPRPDPSDEAGFVDRNNDRGHDRHHD